MALMFLLVLSTPAALQKLVRDGQTDIYWHHRTIGNSGVWLMHGTRFQEAHWITNNLGKDWELKLTGDFNHDDETDLLFRNIRTGENALWLMRSGQRFATAPLARHSTNYQLLGSADFNADGSIDLVWKRPSESAASLWFLQSTNWSGRTGSLPPLPSSDSAYAAFGDFNRDGRADIVIHNQRTGSNILWIMNGTNRVRTVPMQPQPDPRFRIVASGVFNPLGHLDLVWRDHHGSNQLWLMEGPRLRRVVELRHAPDTNWVIAGTGGYVPRAHLSLELAPDSTSVVARRFGPSKTPIELRSANHPAWTVLATNYTAPLLTNREFVPGKRMELRTKDSRVPAGVRLPPTEQRGIAIVVVDQTVAPSLRSELESLRHNLTGDGWHVISTNVPRHHDTKPQANVAPVAAIKNFITNVFAANPAPLHAVLLVGHVPIPYSGFNSPDGHGGRSLPSDAYYADADGIYSDTTMDYATAIDGPPDPRHHNRPGDGKWDQQTVPRAPDGQRKLELAVGRIDFARLPAFGPNAEIDLLRQYLHKNHRYRHKQLTFPDRIIAGSYFYGEDSNNPLFTRALQYAACWFGTSPESTSHADFLQSGEPALWSFHAGWGLPYGVKGAHGEYHTTEHLAERKLNPRTAFCFLYGSYFLDWDYQNNILRALLAASQGSLGSMWFSTVDPPKAGFEILGLGEPIAAGLLRTANSNPTFNGTPMFFSYLGDPTLRLQILAPPSDLSITSGNSTVLRWKRSPDASGYFVYTSTNGNNGPWTRLTEEPLSQTEFVDPAPQPNGIYQVRALALVQTGSGSFTNLSQGIFGSATPPGIER